MTETRNKSQGKKKPKQSKSLRLNSMLLNNEWVKNEIKGKIRKFLERNENEHAIVQNLRDREKAGLRRKFIVIQSYIKKTETFQ